MLKEIWYGLAAYSFGEALTNLASPTAVSLGIATVFMVLGMPTLIMRYEKQLLTKDDQP